MSVRAAVVQHLKNLKSVAQIYMSRSTVTVVIATLLQWENTYTKMLQIISLINGFTLKNTTTKQPCHNNTPMQDSLILIKFCREAIVTTVMNVFYAQYHRKAE